MGNQSDTVSAHFARAAERFETSPISLQLAEMADKLTARLQTAANEHWLDFGAGTGVLSVPLARKVARVTALDTSAAMLARISEKQVANIETLNRDIFCGLSQRYNGIVSSMALHHVADTAGLLECMHANLLPGGQIALIDLYAEDGSFHGDNEGKGVKHLGFDPELLQKQARQAGFRDVELSEFFHIRHRNGRSYPLFLLRGCI